MSELEINAQFENLYDQLSNLTPTSLNNQTWFKAILLDIAHQFHNVGPKQRSILTSQHFKSLKELRNNPGIVLLNPDKESGVVIMNKCEYNSRMLSILSDESKFMPGVEFGGTGKLEGRVNSNLEKLLYMNIINKEEFNFLQPMGSEYPHLYGLPKIRKPNIPLRPILSMCRSPTYNLAKWLTKLLDTIQRNLCKYSLKDSFELVDHSDDINIKEKTMCSFDVNSLFTNVPLKKTIDISL
ncbi:unnamed protein product [Schistosoma margrebowiei]|uniref:Uncharacterized protein n=1 Tax=Schistosoma margrebowiei TaxID=48269 RepID=A0A183LQU0_9TREM|nr:unnamed protein product [Schistosoma margrebowiei]